MEGSATTAATEGHVVGIPVSTRAYGIEEPDFPAEETQTPDRGEFPSSFQYSSHSHGESLTPVLDLSTRVKFTTAWWLVGKKPRKLKRVADQAIFHLFIQMLPAQRHRPPIGRRAINTLPAGRETRFMESKSTVLTFPCWTGTILIKAVWKEEADAFFFLATE